MKEEKCRECTIGQKLSQELNQEYNCSLPNNDSLMLYRIGYYS